LSLPKRYDLIHSTNLILFTARTDSSGITPNSDQKLS
jgi:hypothetical protein